MACAGNLCAGSDLSDQRRLPATRRSHRGPACVLRRQCRFSRRAIVHRTFRPGDPCRIHGRTVKPRLRRRRDRDHADFEAPVQDRDDHEHGRRQAALRGQHVTGSNADSFFIADSCPAAFGIGQPCSPRVIFDPKSGNPGPRTATLTLKGGVDSSAYKTVALSGTATAAQVEPGQAGALAEAESQGEGQPRQDPGRQGHGQEHRWRDREVDPAEDDHPEEACEEGQAVKVSSLAVGRSVTKKIKVKVKKSAKRARSSR